MSTSTEEALNIVVIKQTYILVARIDEKENNDFTFILSIEDVLNILLLIILNINSHR